MLVQACLRLKSSLKQMSYLAFLEGVGFVGSTFTGRLFQMEGAATAKACRLNSVQVCQMASQEALGLGSDLVVTCLYSSKARYTCLTDKCTL